MAGHVFFHVVLAHKALRDLPAVVTTAWWLTLGCVARRAERKRCVVSMALQAVATTVWWWLTRNLQTCVTHRHLLAFFGKASEACHLIRIALTTLS